jgi:uncharacterized protein
MIRRIFKNQAGNLRNGWWIGVFFLLLAVVVLPMILVAKETGQDLAPWMQALAVLLVSCVCQWLRKQPMAQLLGAFDRQWLLQLGWGIGLGALLMGLPALFLTVTGTASWQFNGWQQAAIGAALLLFVGVAVTEELTFRGFMFQRLIAGIGSWPAQIAMSAYFVLNHASALQQGDSWNYLAMANIFIASLMFGFAYLRTASLAMPIGLHLMANFSQGTLLGFGVSGSDQVGVLTPVFSAEAPIWLTGGAFGLEASVPGFVMVVLLTLALWHWRGTKVVSQTAV